MTIEEITQLAEEVAKKYNSEITSPFPYENILKDKKDLQIYLSPLDTEISGAIGFNKKEKKFEILINKEKPQNRINFTLAHEIGHYFLHQDVIKKDDVIDSEDVIEASNVLFRLDTALATVIEKEANNFAASLIMPESLVRRAWKAYGTVEGCAKLFQVSLVAMSIRLERLGLI